MGTLLPVENRLSKLQDTLTKLGYKEPLSIDSLNLVEHIVLDFIKNNNFLQKCLEEANEYKKIAEELGDGVFPFKEENLRLIKDNSCLRQEVWTTKEAFDKIVQEKNKRVRGLESENEDLKYLISQFVERVKNLELENLVKTRKLSELQDKNLEPTVVMSCGKNKNSIQNQKNSKLKLEMDSCATRICPHCVRVKNFVEFGKNQNPTSTDYMQIADSRIDALHVQNRELKKVQTELRELINSMKDQVKTRETEIEKLRKNVATNYVPAKENNNEKDKKLKRLQLELDAIQKRNFDLEFRLQNNILHQKDFMLPTKLKKNIINGIENYPSIEVVALNEKVSLLEKQLSNCCKEKAKLKCILESQLSPRRRSISPPNITKSPSKFNKQINSISTAKSQSKTTDRRGASKSKSRERISEANVKKYNEVEAAESDDGIDNKSDFSIDEDLIMNEDKISKKSSVISFSKPNIRGSASSQKSSNKKSISKSPSKDAAPKSKSKERISEKNMKKYSEVKAAESDDGIDNKSDFSIDEDLIMNEDKISKKSSVISSSKPNIRGSTSSQKSSNIKIISKSPSKTEAPKSKSRERISGSNMKNYDNENGLSDQEVVDLDDTEFLTDEDLIMDEDKIRKKSCVNSSSKPNIGESSSHTSQKSSNLKRISKSPNKTATSKSKSRERISDTIIENYNKNVDFEEERSDHSDFMQDDEDLKFKDDGRKKNNTNPSFKPNIRDNSSQASQKSSNLKRISKSPSKTQAPKSKSRERISDTIIEKENYNENETADFEEEENDDSDFMQDEAIDDGRNKSNKNPSFKSNIRGNSSQTSQKSSKSLSKEQIPKPNRRESVSNTSIENYNENERVDFEEEENDSEFMQDEEDLKVKDDRRKKNNTNAFTNKSNINRGSSLKPSQKSSNSKSPSKTQASKSKSRERVSDTIIENYNENGTVDFEEEEGNDNGRNKNNTNPTFKPNNRGSSSQTSQKSSNLKRNSKSPSKTQAPKSKSRERVSDTIIKNYNENETTNFEEEEGIDDSDFDEGNIKFKDKGRKKNNTNPSKSNINKGNSSQTSQKNSKSPSKTQAPKSKSRERNSDTIIEKENYNENEAVDFEEEEGNDDSDFMQDEEDLKVDGRKKNNTNPSSEPNTRGNSSQKSSNLKRISKSPSKTQGPKSKSRERILGSKKNYDNENELSNQEVVDLDNTDFLTDEEDIEIIEEEEDNNKRKKTKPINNTNQFNNDGHSQGRKGEDKVNVGNSKNINKKVENPKSKDSTTSKLQREFSRLNMSEDETNDEELAPPSNLPNQKGSKVKINEIRKYQESTNIEESQRYNKREQSSNSKNETTPTALNNQYNTTGNLNTRVDNRNDDRVAGRSDSNGYQSQRQQQQQYQNQNTNRERIMRTRPNNENINLELEIESLKSALLLMDHEKDVMRSELDAKDEKLIKLRKENEYSQDELNRLRSRLKSLQVQAGHTEFAQDYEREISLQKRQIDNLRQDLERTKRERDEQMQELRRIQTSRSKEALEKRSMSTELEKKHKETDDLRRQIQKYIEEVRRIEDLLHQKEEEMQMLIEHYRSLSIENTNLESQRSSLERDSSSFRNEARDTIDQNFVLMNQLAGQSSLIKNYELEIEQLTKRIIELDAQVCRSKDSEKSLCCDLKSAQDLIYRMEQNLDKLRLDLSNAESAKNRMEAENYDLQLRIDQLQVDIVKESDSKEPLEGLLSKSREKEIDFQRKIRDLESEIENLKDQIRNQEKRLGECKDEVTKYRLKSAELQNELDKVRRQLETEKMERESAESELRRIREQLSNSSTNLLINSALERGSSRSGSPAGLSGLGSGNVNQNPNQMQVPSPVSIQLDSPRSPIANSTARSMTDLAWTWEKEKDEFH